jgi:hypothetical protein
MSKKEEREREKERESKREKNGGKRPRIGKKKAKARCHLFIY